MIKYLTIFCLTACMAACKNDNKENHAGAAAVRQMDSPAGDSSSLPYLIADKNGIIYLSWVEKKGRHAALKFSFLENQTWSEPMTIASGNNWFVNWADYPVIAPDGKKNLMAHFLEKSDTGTYTYDIMLVTSDNNGKTWSRPLLLHDDGKKAEHGFVSILPYKDGFFACWLDGRNMAMAERMEHHDGHHGEMTLRAAVLDKYGKKINEWELDDRVCECCQTSAAMTANGPVVIYRDRSDNETRDMAIVRLVNGNWTAPRSVYADNWKINACPVNGPRTDAINNNLAVAWFSMKNKKGEVKIVFSKDGGATFDKPVQIDEGHAIGRVDVVMPDSVTAMVCWMEGASIKAAKVHADGRKEPSVVIATSSEKRSSGFPQMARSGNRIFFAWTDDKEKKIKLAVMNLK